MKKTKKNNFVYLVYCNVNPIVYGVYKNKKKALDYAISLIKYREDCANRNGHEFGHYHLIGEDKKRKESEFDKMEKLIFSTCLKIKDGFKDFSQDACWIKVIRLQFS